MAVKCSNCGTEHGDWVPQERLDKMAEQKRDAVKDAEIKAARVKELEGEIQANAAKVAQVDTLTTELESFKTKESAWGLERSIIRSGITEDEGIEFASLAWQRLPEDKRPEGGITAWLSDRGSLPKAVQAYLPAETASTTTSTQTTEATTTQTQQTTETGTQTQRTLPRSNAGVDPTGGAPAAGRFTREQIRAMSPEEFKQNEAAIMAQVREEQGR